MRIFRYWARATAKSIDKNGKTNFRTATGYSNESPEEAFRMAERKAKHRSEHWDKAQVEGDYYGAGTDRPIREQIIEDFFDEGAIEPYAIITRNSYGSLVLNVTDVFFADVDIPVNWSRKRIGSSLLALLGIGKKDQPQSFEDHLIGKINELVDRDPKLGLRVYRTLQGYRIVVTNRRIPAKESKSLELLQGLGSDRLYVNLCHSQDCYRARLTPKPWRSGCKNNTLRFPFESSVTESQHQAWVKQYDATVKDYATCILVGEFGSETKDLRVAAVLKLHDHFVLSDGKPLA